MRAATPREAIAHPNWSMGAKISVDCATLMNKGLELIEAFHLFPLPADAFDIVIHPQSVVHSLVEYVDGSVLAQLGSPDMRIPIAYTLAWPERMATPCERLDLVRIGTPELRGARPRALPGARRSPGRRCGDGGARPAVLNAANEVAVGAFLGGGIGFLDIASIAAETLQCYAPAAPASVEEVLEIDREARARGRGHREKGDALNDNPGLVWTILSFLLVIGPLIFVHELGHYFVGRWFGVKADAFSIGFGREIAGWTDTRGTRWKVGWLPLGGYVKFAGDMNAAGQPSPEWLALPAEERAQTFQAKPVWQRFLIVAGRARLTNFLAAILILTGFNLAYGVPQTPAVIGGCRAGDRRRPQAGLRPGDRIVRIDGKRIDRFEDIAADRRPQDRRAARASRSSGRAGSFRRRVQPRS